MSTGITRTGLDSAGTMTPGSIIDRVYWAVPEAHSPGGRHDTERSALAYAIASTSAAIAKSKASNAGVSYVSERVTVDCRWDVSNPAGGSQDFVASRTTYDTLDAAREHLVRIDRFAARYPHGVTGRPSDVTR